ncbi:MAG TPA: response regulator [Polyangiaceae bacterium]|jgi:CheY-like chemotaxis protein
MNARQQQEEAPKASPRTEQPEAKPVALVVDGDGVSRRFVELALGRRGVFVVEAARDTAAALDILGSARVDVIVAELDLPDTSGLRLLRRLAQEQRLRGIPFVFLAASARTDARVAAFRAGADDFLTKPADADELFARVEALVTRRRRERDDARRRGYTLAGDFGTLPFPDLVSILSMGQRSGSLAILTPRSAGSLVFDGGMPVHAAFGNLVGVEAFRAIVNEAEGHFEFAHGPCDVPAEQRTVHETVNALLLDAARIFDESSNSETARPPAIDPTSVPTARPPASIQPALEPSTTLAAQLEMALRDPFALGEPRLWSDEQLAKWTYGSTGGDRLHVHVVADLSAGVSSILALAGSPTERWVLDGLAARRKAFGLTFFLRHERTIDLVLLDASDPASFGEHLRRAPAFMVVAPPGGDFMDVGTKARVALHSLIDRLSPPAIVGVGNAALDGALRRLGVDAASSLRCVQGTLGEGNCDLRSLLVRGVRLWASTAGRWQPLAAVERS